MATVDPADVARDALSMAREAIDTLAAALAVERSRRRAAEAERDRAIHDRDKDRQELADYQVAAGLEPRWRTQEETS